jgi:TetR/AcrR family transcriptional regulator, cholesterol catabolism regulator
MPQTRAKDKQGKSVKWQQRRHEIVDVSAKVFAERGYHATSTTELCEANGIGKGALYYYIGSKEQLLAAINDRVMDEVMRGADRVALAGGPPREQPTPLRAEAPYEQRVQAVFGEGIESGDFRPLDTRLAVDAWLGMHNYTYLWLRAGGHYSVKEVAKSFADIFIWGIATRTDLDGVAEPVEPDHSLVEAAGQAAGKRRRT